MKRTVLVLLVAAVTLYIGCGSRHKKFGNDMIPAIEGIEIYEDRIQFSAIVHTSRFIPGETGSPYMIVSDLSPYAEEALLVSEVSPESISNALIQIGAVPGIEGKSGPTVTGNIIEIEMEFSYHCGTGCLEETVLPLHEIFLEEPPVDSSDPDLKGLEYRFGVDTNEDPTPTETGIIAMFYQSNESVVSNAKADADTWTADGEMSRYCIGLAEEFIPIEESVAVITFRPVEGIVTDPTSFTFDATLNLDYMDDIKWLIVNIDSPFARKSLFVTEKTQSEISSALLDIEADPFNEWIELDETLTGGSVIKITVTWEGAVRWFDLEDFIVETPGEGYEPRGFEMRFGYTYPPPPDLPEGQDIQSVAYLTSYTNSILSNAMISQNDFILSQTEYSAMGGVLPDNGTAVSVKFRRIN